MLGCSRNKKSTSVLLVCWVVRPRAPSLLSPVPRRHGEPAVGRGRGSWPR